MMKTNMKKDWEIKKLGDVCDVRDGTHDSPKYQEEGYPLITSKNLKKGEIVYHKVKYISRKDYNHINKRSKVDIGDILFAMIGTIGNPVVVINKPDYAIKNVALFKVGEYLNSYFLKYFLSSKFVIDKMQGDAKGTTQKFVGLGYLRKFEIPIPTLKEQQQIVAILNKAFAAIATAKDNALQNGLNAKQLFESYLQNIFENKGEDWEEKILGDVCESVFAGGDKPKKYSKFKTDELSIPIYANAVKLRGLYGFTNTARVTKPSVTISARGSGTGHTELRNEHFLPIVRLIVVIPISEMMDLEFLKRIIDSLVIVRSGSAIPQLTVPMIKKYQLSFPPIKEQQQIVKKLNNLSAKTKKLEVIYQQKIEDLEELKKSLLQRAFNGQLLIVNDKLTTNH